MTLIRELARQKNTKQQNDMQKGKRNDGGLSAAARKQREPTIPRHEQNLS
uniref:Small EDRK-rich factor-like N-terminal domain-containing protein n=1 Tax=Sinocyclocheilus grahami TaxID=75366 RepID=A0A672RU52_SINGR